MPSAKRTPQQVGRDYERELAVRLGGREQPASGAGPRFKLDCKLGSLLFSAKHTEHESYRLAAAELREMEAGARGPGGRGEVPAMAIRMAGYPDDVVVMRGSDLRAMLEGELAPPTFTPSRRAVKLAAARAR